MNYGLACLYVYVVIKRVSGPQGMWNLDDIYEKELGYFAATYSHQFNCNSQ